MAQRNRGLCSVASAAICMRGGPFFGAKRQFKIWVVPLLYTVDPYKSLQTWITCRFYLDNFTNVRV